MYSLQEICSKFKPQLDAVEKRMDAYAEFHPADISVLDGVNLKPAERTGIKETLKAMPLGYMMKEFLVSGLAGAAYLIPDKIYDILFEAGAVNDIVPECAPIVSCPGSVLKVDVEKDGQFKAHFVGGGGEAPVETVHTSEVQITPRLFSIRPAISQELIEDSQFDLIELHLRRAGEMMGQFSTEQYLACLTTGASTGADGTQNTVDSGTNNVMDLSDIVEAWAANLEDGFLSDVIILPPTLYGTVLKDNTVSMYSDSWHTRMAENRHPLVQAEFMGMSVIVVKHMNTAYAGDGRLYDASSKWHAFVLDKAHASLTVRKRWMRIDNYSDPVRDLVGAVVSARQDSETIYNDASCEITATA